MGTNDLLQGGDVPMMPGEGAPEEAITPPEAPAQPIHPDLPPQIPSQGGMASEEQKQQLQAMMDMLKDKFAEFNSSKLSGGNESKAQKEDMIKQVLQMMSEMGVDLTDMESIQKFLGEMEQVNPEIYKMLIGVLDSVFGDGQPQGPDLSQVPEGTPPPEATAAPATSFPNLAQPSAPLAQMPPMPNVQQ